MTTNTSFETDTTTITDEWNYNIWTDSIDWCTKCKNKNNKLHFDDQTKTTKCPKCEHTQTYEESDWKILQAKRYVISRYMPGKYFFHNLTTEQIFDTYLREHNNFDWLSWVIHDYVLARMRNDQTIQNKLKDAAKQIVEKMEYDPKLWQTYFERIDTQDPNIFRQVPQITYEYTTNHLKKATTKENHPEIIHSYLTKLSSLYCYSRWKGDRVTCWIINEIIKLCDTTDKDAIEFYTTFFSNDPLLDNFQEDILTKKKKESNLNDTYIQWQLKLADKFVEQSKSFVAVQIAYEALGAKLGIHALWPPTKILPFDANTVKKVTLAILNKPELYRLYDLATELDATDPAKARYYTTQFIKKVKEILPQITNIKQEQIKQKAYIT